MKERLICGSDWYPTTITELGVGVPPNLYAEALTLSMMVSEEGPLGQLGHEGDSHDVISDLVTRDMRHMRT